MAICTNCGEHNPDNTSRCTKCGVALRFQIQAKSDATRSRVANSFKLLTRIVVLVIVACLIIPIYRYAGKSYFTYRLNTVKEAAMKTCNGPVTETTASFQKVEIERCLANDEALTKVRRITIASLAAVRNSLLS